MILAALPLSQDLKDFFGAPTPPPGIAKYDGGSITGITLLLSNILKLTIYAAGLYALVNLLVSGIQYIGSSGNPELLKQASSRIWISLLGLLVVAIALLLAGLIGWIFFKDAMFIIAPSLPDPGGFGSGI
ncbi:MAG: hypothetical protein V1810_00810 [Candidatus Beckwithbacteria bacterium]